MKLIVGKAKVKSILGPPERRPWVWIETEMLASAAWRSLSINGRRLIDFLLIEHRNHAGLENGNLKATYRQLQAFGMTADSIKSAIDECENKGFIRTKAQGYEDGRYRRKATVFRLTFYAGSATSKIAPPTNEWKGVEIQKSTRETRSNLHRKSEAVLPRKPEAA